MRRTWLLPALALLLSQEAVAQTDDPLATAGRDPMELARAVDRVGDEALLERLGGEDRARLLTAIHASPWMRGPEQALPRLSTFAVGRDPALAPAAVMASVIIARRLDAGSLFRREAPATELVEAATRFERLAEDGTARSDLRAAARVIVAQLTDAGALEAPPEDDE